MYQLTDPSRCGINIISFYSSTIFVDAGYTPVEALYASLGYGAIQVVATIPTLFLIDTKGRRKLCMIVGRARNTRPNWKFSPLTVVLKTFPLMCIFLLAAGLSLLNSDDGRSRAAHIGPVVL